MNNFLNFIPSLNVKVDDFTNALYTIHKVNKQRHGEVQLIDGIFMKFYFTFCHILSNQVNYYEVIVSLSS